MDLYSNYYFCIAGRKNYDDCSGGRWCHAYKVVLTKQVRAVHLTSMTTEPLQRLFDKYRSTGTDRQEELATPGSVQLRQTLAL